MKKQTFWQFDIQNGMAKEDRMEKGMFFWLSDHWPKENKKPAKALEKDIFNAGGACTETATQVQEKCFSFGKCRIFGGNSEMWKQK